MKLDLTSLKKAVKSLSSALTVAYSSEQMDKMSVDARDAIKAGVIQKFEFTYELCWKFIKRRLEDDLGSAYIDGLSRRELFRIGAEHRLIDNVEVWMEYHDQRNETAHTYDEDTANEVFATAKKFLVDAAKLLSNLEAHNA